MKVRQSNWMNGSAPLYAYNVHSQNGEDGIVKKLFEVLDIDHGYVCEFGACDGIYLSNTYNIYKNNSRFIPVLIEPDAKQFNEMQTNLADIKHKIALNLFVSPERQSDNSLDEIFDRLNLKDFHEKFRLLSIDVDSCDYEIWQSLENYRPTVVIIEINSEYPPDQEVYPCEPYGASAAIVNKLAKSKGYELVAHTGNLIFVTREQFSKLNIKDNRLETLFSNRWVREKQCRESILPPGFDSRGTGFTPDLSFLKGQ